MRLLVHRTWDGAPCGPRERVKLDLEVVPEGLRVSTHATDHGDPLPDAPDGPLWGLWEHEVVELFVLGPDERYTELELGPRHYLLLRLAGRRNPVEKLLPLDIDRRAVGKRIPGTWQARTLLPWSVLPPRPWRLNAYAIHGVGPARRYLAWEPVPGPAPDFHRLECFRPVAF